MNGQKLRSFRARRGLSGSDIARALGVQRTRVSTVEHSQVTLPYALRYLRAVERLDAGRMGREPRPISITVLVTIGQPWRDNAEAGEMLDLGYKVEANDAPE